MRRTIIGVFLGLSLLLNVLVVSVTSVATAVGGLFEAVTGVASVISVVASDTRRLTREVADLRVKNSAITKKNTALLREVADLRKERLVVYRGNKRLIRDAVADTSERVVRRTAIGASRNLSATFGEAIPVAGIAVIVAGTALELNDACSVMQDLHELDVAFNPEKAFGADATEVCGMKAPTAEELWEAVKASPGAVWEGVQENIPSVPEIDTSTLKSWVPSFELPW